jgi:hypothetical protein
MLNRTLNGRFAMGFSGCIAAMVLSSSVMASGSFGGSAGIGLHNSYNLGKSLFYKELACPDCPASAKKMDMMGAQELINKLNKDEMFAKKLMGSKREAVIVYLKRRYKAG